MDLNTVTEVRAVRARRDLDALAEEGTAILAGGTWLFSAPQRHLRTLLDLTTAGWEPLVAGDDGLEVAATCTIGELSRLPARPGWRAHPLLAWCCRALLASFAVRHTATVGGNVCLALPAGAMTSLAGALDGTALVWGPGGAERRLPVADLVTGPGRTQLARGEVLRSLHLPAAALRSRVAFRRTSLAARGRSASLVVGRLGEDGFVLSVTAAVPRPLVLRFPGICPPERLRAALDAVPVWFDDAHGAPDWRRAVTGVLAEQVRAELAGPPRARAGAAGEGAR
ncbi:FAD binding domain-containing protein [Kineococcus glutinatus]|uniref:FAD binding domain-containing protein n=1 Tax=Kineococcus glutinatus TaxID=1070872 RepID=UPI0031EAB526